jgi:fructoselysine-6-P-deglycase FrlB-like protein
MASIVYKVYFMSLLSVPPISVPSHSVQSSAPRFGKMDVATRMTAQLYKALPIAVKQQVPSKTEPATGPDTSHGASNQADQFERNQFGHVGPKNPTLNYYDEATDGPEASRLAFERAQKLDLKAFNQVDQWLVVGSGSSLNAALMAENTLAQATGKPVKCLTSEAFLRNLQHSKTANAAKGFGRVGIIAVSQSGNSSILVNAIKQLQAQAPAAKVLTVTNTADSALATMAGPAHTLVLGAKPERSIPATGTVSATVAGLMGLANRLSAGTQAPYPANPFKQTETFLAEHFWTPKQLNQMQAFATALVGKPGQQPSNPISLIGSPDHVPLLQEAGLKLAETSVVITPYIGSSETFRHGPVATITRAIGDQTQMQKLFYLVPSDPAEANTMYAHMKEHLHRYSVHSKAAGKDQALQTYPPELLLMWVPKSRLADAGLKPILSAINAAKQLSGKTNGKPSAKANALPTAQVMEIPDLPEAVKKDPTLENYHLLHGFQLLSGMVSHFSGNTSPNHASLNKVVV